MSEPEPDLGQVRPAPALALFELYDDALPPPPHATRFRHGDIAYVTLVVPDASRAKQFYAAVLGWHYAPGSVEEGWQVEDTLPPAGLWGGQGAQERGEVQLCYRVADLEAAIARVRDAGGAAEEPQERPYGRLADCTDDQGMTFQLWSTPS